MTDVIIICDNEKTQRIIHDLFLVALFLQRLYNSFAHKCKKSGMNFYLAVIIIKYQNK